MQVTFNDYQLEQLAKRAISVQVADSFGIRSVTDQSELPEGCPTYWTADNGYLPGLLFPWKAEDGRTEYQLRPDTPPKDKNNRPQKYVARSREDGYQPVLWVAKRGTPNGVRIITEGTCQTVVAATYAPEDAWILGIFGCRGWMSDGVNIPDLDTVDGHRVVVALDADMWSNTDVWDAGEQLQAALKAEGAESVSFLKLPASGKVGLDDYLASKPAERRREIFTRCIESSVIEKFPKSRRPKKNRKRLASEGEEVDFFDDNGLRTEDLSNAVRDRYPVALTSEHRVAVYRNGVYHINDMAFKGVLSDLLGNAYRTHYRSTVEEFTAGRLYNDGILLPDRAPSPFLNCANGMVNLLTYEFVPHDPSYMSCAQIPVEWDPDATCPIYDEWIQKSAPQQVEDLEESVSLMLDPSRTPARAVFLWGPSRSGKSTFLRILQHMVGQANRSSVTLHQLVENRFMAANIYGKMLNVAADIPSAHLEDVSIFKMMTGEDPIQADRKHGSQFTYINNALFAFSGNTLPTVGEASNAYSARIKPFNFPNSFEGQEDVTLENKLLRELPGILVRWVKAYRTLIERGRPLKTHEIVRQEFERQSDRVKQFIDECCEIIPSDTHPSTQWSPSDMATSTELASAFKKWAEANNSRHFIGRNRITERVRGLSGVVPVATPKNSKGFNVRIKPQTEWESKSSDLADILNAVSSTQQISQPDTDTVELPIGKPEQTEDVEDVDYSDPEIAELHGGYGNLALGNGYPHTVEDILACARPIPDEERKCRFCGGLKEHVPTEAGELACPYCSGTFSWTMEDPYGFYPKPETSWPGRRCKCPDCRHLPIDYDLLKEWEPKVMARKDKFKARIEQKRRKK